MKSDVMITQEGELMKVHGDLTYETVLPLRQQGNQLMAVMDKPRIDFIDVGNCNSAGLALMIAWLRQAKQLKKSIDFVNVPQSLQEVANVCGVGGILELE